MKRVENYINSILPSNISKKKKQLISEEIESHIFERIDFYIEIGYDENSSIQKALADMGEDEEIKESIKNDFAELHSERTWWAVVTALLMFVLNMIAFFTDTWITSADSIGSPDINHVIISFALVFSVIISIIFLYKKGYRKCLVGLGVSNLIIILSFLLMFYPQCAVSAVSMVSAYLLDMYTPLCMGNVVLYGLSSVIVYGSIAVIFVIALSCFILSFKIKKHGKPSKKKHSGIILFCVIYLYIAVFSSFMCDKAEKYFDEYPTWFNVDGDTFNTETEMFYNHINENSDYTEISDLLESYGYITTTEYEKSLDKSTAKKFRHELNQMDFMFNDKYEIWFNPQKHEERPYGYHGNGFVFLLPDSNGKIRSKGVGNGFSDVMSTHLDYSKSPGFVEAFKSIKTGDSESDVLYKFISDYGGLYSAFTTYTDGGIETYYRFNCVSKYHSDELEGTLFFKNNLEVYIEFTFKNGVLEDGKLHYMNYNRNKEEYISLTE